MPLPNSLAAFPATDPGFAALPVSELLASADDLVSRIRLCFGLSRDAFDSEVQPLLQRYASSPTPATNRPSAGGVKVRTQIPLPVLPVMMASKC